MKLKLIATFSGIALLEAILIILITRSVGDPDNLLIMLFPGLLGMAFDGVSVYSILIFLIITFIVYGVVGGILCGIYELLKKFLPSTGAFVAVCCVPVLIVGAFWYKDYQDYRTYLHLDDTPQNCAQLPPNQKSWCFRSIYNRYPLPEVCARLEDGDATQCWQLCKQADPNCTEK